MIRRLALCIVAGTPIWLALLVVWGLTQMPPERERVRAKYQWELIPCPLKKENCP